MIPVEVAFLIFPRRYYEELWLEVQKTRENREEIKDLLKGSYISELESAIEINEHFFRMKSDLFHNAIRFALFSIIPYLVCLAFHIFRVEENIQKVQLVSNEINGNFMESNNMPKNKKPSAAGIRVTTRKMNLPGIDNSKIIISTPNIIKENGLRPGEKKVGALDSSFRWQIQIKYSQYAHIEGGASVPDNLEKHQTFNESMDTLHGSLNAFIPNDYSAINISSGDANLDGITDKILLLKKNTEETTVWKFLIYSGKGH